VLHVAAVMTAPIALVGRVSLPRAMPQLPVLAISGILELDRVGLWASGRLGPPSSTPSADSEPFSHRALNEINNLAVCGEVSVVAICVM
jgi:hypothetical protein